jgi:hypothetical protein
MLVSVEGCSAPSILSLVFITCTSSSSASCNCCTSPPGYPCWSASRDALVPAPSKSSPSPAPPALPPPFIALDSYTSKPDRPCCSAWRDAPLLAPSSRLHHLHKQLFGLLSSPLIPKRRREVGHAGQRVEMLYSQHPLSHLCHF